VLGATEVEQVLAQDVSIYQGEHKSKYAKGLVRLTSHRIIWQANGIGCVSLSLALVAKLALVDGGWRASPKLTLELRDGATLTYAFKEGGRDDFVDKLKAVMAARAWLADQPAARSASAPAATAAAPKKEFSTASAGITGIMKKAKDDAQRADATLNTAFADIDELMLKAKDVVQLAQKLAAAQARQAKAAGGEGADDAAFRAAMVQLGIASPVTRETAGSKYHDELSRQLAEWLLKRPLQMSGGVLLMTDLYCMFNRARGTDMVSPDDLLRACMLFEPLKLPVRLKKFDSGVLVVMAAAESDEAIAKKMEAEIKKRGPLSAFTLASALAIPLILAREQLEMAEQLCVLCRDETLEGIVFYPNFFPFVS
jgi:ESCRT-II complex subunit VPS36